MQISNESTSKHNIFLSKAFLSFGAWAKFNIRLNFFLLWRKSVKFHFQNWLTLFGYIYSSKSALFKQTECSKQKREVLMNSFNSKYKNENCHGHHVLMRNCFNVTTCYIRQIPWISDCQNVKIASHLCNALLITAEDEPQTKWSYQ